MWRRYFVPFRCTLCTDQTAELADASFGDVWLPEYQQDKIGTSLCIVRNPAFYSVFERMIRKQIIDVKSVQRSVVLRSQSTQLTFKKKNIAARRELCKKFGKVVPNYEGSYKSANVNDYLSAISIYFQIYISSKRGFWPLLNPLGLLLERMGSLKKNC